MRSKAGMTCGVWLSGKHLHRNTKQPCNIFFVAFFFPSYFYRIRPSGTLGRLPPHWKGYPSPGRLAPPLGGPPRQAAEYRGEVRGYARVFLKAWRLSTNTPL